jgi:lysine 2,3-aminomutase
MGGLRGHTSGYAIPTYVIDTPGGGGKVPLLPNYLISQAPGKVVVRNFEGLIATYTEPTDHDPHLVERQSVSHRPEPGQEGMLGLLEGSQLTIEPVGYATIHERGGLTHRLRGEASKGKWQPLGLDTISLNGNGRHANLSDTTATLGLNGNSENGGA